MLIAGAKNRQKRLGTDDRDGCFVHSDRCTGTVPRDQIDSRLL
jgi:hypothetical protein